MLRGSAVALPPMLVAGLVPVACSLPGGEGAEPSSRDCAVRIENEVRSLGPGDGRRLPGVRAFREDSTDRARPDTAREDALGPAPAA
jgi:hypothetical protein